MSVVIVVARTATREVFAPDGAEVAPPVANVQASVADAHGGSPSDYSVFIYDDNALYKRVHRDGDEFTLSWPVGQAQPVFTFAASRPILRVTSSASRLRANGTATVTLTFTAMKADLSGTDTAVTGNKDIPVDHPRGGRALIAVTFANGVGTLAFKTSGLINTGEWRFPGGVRRFEQLQTDGQSAVVLNVFAQAADL